jgi:hypothetical protein
MMLRSLLLASALLLLPVLGQAQIRFGIAGEVNNTSFGGVAPQHAEYGTQFGGGVSGILELRVHPDVVLSFQPGWMQKGAKIVFNQDEQPDSVLTFNVNQSWLTLPVYFRIDSDNRGFYAGGGISVDLLLDSELEHEGTTADNKDVFEDVDFVYQFLFGYMHDFGGYGGFLEARYMQGMKTINKTNQTTVGNIYVADFKSNGLRLVAGVLF